MARAIQLASLILLGAGIALYVLDLSSRDPENPAAPDKSDRSRSPLVDLPPDIRSAFDVLRRLDEGQSDAALQLAQVLVAEERSALNLAVLGLVFLKRLEYGNAGDALRQALELDPDHPVASAGMGLWSLAHQRFDEAVRHLAPATLQAPTHWEWWRSLALAHLGAGHAELALAAISKARSLRPSDPLIAETTADCLLRLGRETDAAAWYARARPPDSHAPSKTCPDRVFSALSSHGVH